ncbi:MAG: choice-of-anchor J domain-containing protein [Candidatus Delongbacteria bacterium]|nr:choice-of-anchor J domain-containing protein [Candidatus Delongbacteria bacterium]
MKILNVLILLLMAAALTAVTVYETGFETDPFQEGWSLSTSGAGWKRISVQTDPFAANSGSYGMGHLDDTGIQSDWLISPPFDFPDENGFKLSFYESGSFTDYYGLHEVSVSTNGGDTWTVVYSDVPEEWNFNQISLDLAQFAGETVQIGWYYSGDYSDQWFIDDVSVTYDNTAPEIFRLSSAGFEPPVLAAYSGNDIELKIELIDESGISEVRCFYNYEGDPADYETVFSDTGDPFIYEGFIPGQNAGVSGTMYFRVTDSYGNGANSNIYSFEFLYDDLAPEIISVRGLINLTGNDAEITVALKEHTGVSSITGYYSSDGFITVDEFNLIPPKDIFYNFKGTVPAETTPNHNCGLYFVISDSNGNEITTSIYNMKWINSYSELKKFDLRTDLGRNYVSSVKNQPNGTCWMYSTCALMESNLLMTGNWAAAGEEGEPDLSEYHMSWWFGFNDFFNADADPVTGDGLELHLQGGYFLNSAYMLRGEGAVRQTDSYSFEEPPERFSKHYNIYYPRSVEWFPMDAELNGIETIKQKVIEFGAAGVTLKHTSYDPSTYIHYQSPEDPTYFSHGVSIIGWDDDKITQASEGPGAWYCKNSWGEDFGFDGFYWVSYYDKHACRSMSGAASFQNVERMKYDDVYYHDYHGYSSVLPDINEAFNAFTVRESSKLSSVSFFNAVNNVDYTVKIYSDFTDGELTGLISETSGHIDFKGYHTIDLTEPPLLYQGNTFYIYLNLSDGGQPIDQTSYVQVAYLWYTSKASPGESYYFEGGEWKDLYYNSDINRPGTANFCIKGLVQHVSDISGTAIPSGTELYQNYPNPFNPSTTISYSIPNNSRVDLNIYNMNGQLVKDLVNKVQPAGKHSVEFYSEDLSSGVYFYRLSIDGKTAGIKKMLLVR